MKNNLISLAVLLPLCLSVFSCEMSRSEWIDLDDYGSLDASKSFIPFASSSTLLDAQAFGACTLPGGGTVSGLEDGDGLTKTTSTNGAGLLRALISHTNRKKIISYCGSYMSTDEYGKPIRLSGRIVLPESGRVSRIMIVGHYTIGCDSEAPSNEVTIESMYAAEGIAVLQSDYIGYGVSADRIHPYLCSEVTARNVVDMYYAALPFLEKIGRMPDYDDVFLLGFSQGGAVTMSVAQAITQFHPDIRIRLAMAGGGPYDICATYDTLIENDFTDYPCAVPMIIQGMNIGNGLNLDYGDFFLPRMVENLDEWVNSKKYTVGEITLLIGSKRISAIMTEQAMNKTNDEMTDLYRAMVDNSVVNETMPHCPIYLFHSIDDKVVPFVNAYNLKQKLDINGCNVIYNFGHYGNHQMATLRFMLACMDLLKENGDIK